MGMTLHSQTTDTEKANPAETQAHEPGNDAVQPAAGPTEGPPASQGARRRGRGGWRFYTASAVVCLLIIGLTWHFARFTESVVGAVARPEARADGVVVLTGGAERVQRAVGLLAEGRGRRLLISGVHPGTTRKQIISLTSADQKLFDCCVDLDRIALNTEGNAVETAQWVRDNSYSSLLVVTSAYHLPRAQLELREMLPDVELIPYPVFAQDLDLKRWYMHGVTIKLLMREYVKYTVARIRIAFRTVF